MALPLQKTGSSLLVSQEQAGVVTDNVSNNNTTVPDPYNVPDRLDEDNVGSGVESNGGDGFYSYAQQGEKESIVSGGPDFCYSTTFRRLRNFLKPHVTSTWFDLVSLFFIFLSALFIGIEAEFGALGKPLPLWLDVCKGFNQVVFIIEWTLRFFVGGRSWLRQPINLIFTTSVWLPLALMAWSSNIALLRVGVRMLRLTKVLYALNNVGRIKNITSLQVARQLLSGLFASAGTLFSSILLLSTTLLFAAVLSVDFIGFNNAWQYQPAGSPARKFIKVSDAIFQMSRFLFGDGATDILEYLMQTSWMKVSSPTFETHGQPFIWIYIFGFQAVAQFVILNMITAIIVDNSKRIHNADDAANEAEAAEVRSQAAQALADYFSEASDEADKVDAQKLLDNITNASGRETTFSEYLSKMGLSPEEFYSLTEGLIDGQDTLDINFFQSLPDLFGEATAYNLLKAAKKAEKLEKTLKRIIHKRRDDAKGHKKRAAEQSTDQGRELEKELDALQKEVEGRLNRLDGMVKDILKSASRVEQALRSVGSV